MDGKSAPLIVPRLHGWPAEKVRVFREAFFEFLNEVYINSKDLGGHTCLGKHIFMAQRMFLDDLCAGLEEGIHDFYILKSRQLGMSTISRALSTFWLGIHDGLQGAIVFDTDKNRSQARREIESMIDNLPDKIKFPRIKSRNRDGLTLYNESTIQFLSAGVKQSKSSGVLGRSSGLSFSHCSEMCSWDNPEGLTSFRQSLSETNPDRLYIWESTARGPNQWKLMWEEARDNSHAKCTFLGWWSKDTQIIPQDDPDFARYGYQEPTEREIEKMQQVEEDYGVRITQEQLAWIRRKMNPTAEAEGDSLIEYEGDSYQIQEQAWTEEDAFQMTGATFFPPEVLADVGSRHLSKKYRTYMYSTGIEFVDCRIWPASNNRSVELKVWDEPEDGATYVISADPAYGANEHNDRAACQVMRAYADGLDQVAEYAWPMANTMQFAWVIASLLGWYSGKANDVYFILELNGPGDGVWKELQHLRRQMENGYQPTQVEERGLTDIFRNVRNYIYTRSDSMSPGHVWQWKMTQPIKVSLMERLRDFVTNGMLHVRSIDTLEEMRWITREGDSIEAQGAKKDDRVISLALAVRCWEDRVRRGLVAQRKTRDFALLQKSHTIQDQASLFHQHQLETFFAVKRSARIQQTSIERRAMWRAQPSRQPSWRSGQK